MCLWRYIQYKQMQRGHSWQLPLPFVVFLQQISNSSGPELQISKLSSYAQILQAIDSQLHRKIINISKTKSIGQALYSQLYDDILRLKNNNRILAKLQIVQGTPIQMVEHLQNTIIQQGQLLFASYQQWSNHTQVNAQIDFDEFVSQHYQKYSRKVEKQVITQMVTLVTQANAISMPSLNWKISDPYPQTLQNYNQMIQLLTRFRSMLSTQYQQLLSPKSSSQQQCKSAVIFLAYLRNLFQKVKNAICDRTVQAETKQKSEEDQEIEKEAEELCLLTKMYSHANWVKNRVVNHVRKVYEKYIRAGQQQNNRGWPQPARDDNLDERDIDDSNSKKLQSSPDQQKAIMQQAQMVASKHKPKKPTLIRFQPPTYHQLQSQTALYQHLSSLPISSVSTLPACQSQLCRHLLRQANQQQIGKQCSKMWISIHTNIQAIQSILKMCKVVCFREVERRQSWWGLRMEQQIKVWNNVGIAVEEASKFLSRLGSAEIEVRTLQDKCKRSGQYVEQRYKGAQNICMELYEIAENLHNLILKIKKYDIFAGTELVANLQQKVHMCNTLRRHVNSLPLLPVFKASSFNIKKQNQARPVQPVLSHQQQQTSAYNTKQGRASTTVKQKRASSTVKQKRAQSKVQIYISEDQSEEGYVIDVESQIQKASQFVNLCEQFFELELRNQYTTFELLMAVVEPNSKSRNKLLASMRALQQVNKLSPGILPKDMPIPPPLSSLLNQHRLSLQTVSSLFLACLTPLSCSLSSFCKQTLCFENQDWQLRIKKHASITQQLQRKQKEIQKLQQDKITILINSVLKIVREFSYVFQVLVDVVKEIGYFYRQVKNRQRQGGYRLLDKTQLQYLINMLQYGHKIRQEITELEKLTNLPKNSRVYLKQIYANFSQQYQRTYLHNQGQIVEIIKLSQNCINFKQSYIEILAIFQQQVGNKEVNSEEGFDNIRAMCAQLLELRRQMWKIYQEDYENIVEAWELDQIKSILTTAKPYFELATAIHAYSYDPKNKNKAKVILGNQKMQGLYNKFIQMHDRYYR